MVVACTDPALPTDKSFGVDGSRVTGTLPCGQRSGEGHRAPEHVPARTHSTWMQDDWRWWSEECCRWSS